MSGVIWMDPNGAADNGEPRRAFGTRQPPAPDPGRSIDRDVAALRRRIGPPQHRPGSRGKLPWAIGGVLILGLSLALWLNALGLAGIVARTAGGF